MKRKELYKKMFEAVISEAGISGEVLSDIQDDIDLYKFSTANISFETCLDAETNHISRNL